MKARKVISAAVAGLCAISTMSMSVFAAADNTEDFQSSGEKAYKISAAFQAPTLKVTVPTAMNAVLNPYKIVITTETGDTGTDGVTSPEYTIANNDETFGITVAARATASGLDAIVDDASKVTVASGNQPKNAFIKLCATPVADGDGKGDYSDVDNDDLAKASELVFKEEMETAVKLMQITKAADADTPSKGFVKIAGDIPTEPTEKWATSDKLALNVVFDINPYNPDAAGGGADPAPSGPKFANASDVTISASGGANAITFTFDPDTTTYSITSDLDTTGGRLDLAVGTVTGATVAITADETTMSYNSTNQRITSKQAGTGWVKITLTDDTDPSKTTTYTLNFTVS